MTTTQSIATGNRHGAREIGFAVGNLMISTVGVRTVTGTVTVDEAKPRTPPST
jgi:hypothetical protein